MSDPTQKQVREALDRLCRGGYKYGESGLAAYQSDRSIVLAALSDDWVRVPRSVLEEDARGGDGTSYEDGVVDTAGRYLREYGGAV